MFLYILYMYTLSYLLYLIVFSNTSYYAQCIDTVMPKIFPKSFIDAASAAVSQMHCVCARVSVYIFDRVETL